MFIKPLKNLFKIDKTQKLLQFYKTLKKQEEI